MWFRYGIPYKDQATETGELIPSSGRRGRTSKNVATTEEGTISAKITDLQNTISEKEAEIDSLQSEVKDLKAAIRSYEKVCASISNALGNNCGTVFCSQIPPNLKEKVQYGSAIIIIIAGILNLVIDKFITDQADKISLYLMHNYLQKVYLSVSLNENGTAPEIIAFIRQSIAKGL